MSLVVCILLLVAPASADYICGPKLGVEIKRTAWEGLGIKKIQAMYDTEAEFQVAIPNGGERVSQVANDLSAYIEQRYTTVRANQAAILKSLDGTAGVNDQDVGRCCDLNTSSLVYIPHLKTKVDTRTMCVWGCKELDHINSTTISTDIVQSMRINAARLPNLDWQHYTTNHGFHFTFMAHKLCQKVDPRDRPFYKESISQKPMDIVIAIDVSDHGNLHLKTKAATTLVTSTDPRNRIAIVKFCREAWSPLGQDNACVSSSLALATSPNVKTFTKFLAKPEPRCGNEVDYTAGIKKAFSYFKKGSATGKVLLFLTDSDPGGVFSHEEIRQKARQENLRVNNSVVIVTYGFGSGLSSANLLQDLASNTSCAVLDGKDNVIEGSYTNINSTTNLHHQLGSFYSILAAARPAHHPIITAPYLDTSGLGLVVSVCLPIVQDSKLHGVTCVDDRVEDMFLNVTYFSQGFRAYMFLVDTAGRTILHPLLPRPSTTHHRPVLVHISTLETGPGIQHVIDSMTKGETGYKSLYVKRRFDQGSSYGERPVNRKVATHYYWTKVNNTDFSLCLVFTAEDGDIAMRIKTKQKVNFHDSTVIDMSPGTPRCNYNGLDVIKAGSTVAFNGSAYKYIDYQLPEIRARGLHNYFVGSAEDKGQHFVGEMKAEVELTGRADLVWSSPPSSLFDSIIDWRFLVTKRLIRLYPGTTFNTFDPTLQGWYQNAISNRGKVVFTRIGKKEIRTIILSSVIFAGNPTGHHSSQDLPVAVLAGEFSCNYFFKMMEKTFPICKQNNTVCFLVDDKGYILVHTFYIDSWRTPSHLVSLEPDVAQELTDRGHLTKYKCLDLMNYRTIESWTLSPEDWIVKGERFELHRVAGTNIFAGIAFRSTDIRSEKCDCKNVTQCSKLCRCPCHEPLTFDYCQDKPHDLDDTPPCAIEDEIFDPIIKTQALASQETFIKTSCPELITKEECSGNFWCSWCSVSGREARCHEDEKCRKTTSPPPTATSTTLPTTPPNIPPTIPPTTPPTMPPTIPQATPSTAPMENSKATYEKEAGIMNLEFVKGVFAGMAIAVIVCAVICCVYRHVGTSRAKRAGEGDYAEPPIPTAAYCTTPTSLAITVPPNLPPRDHVSANQLPAYQKHLNSCDRAALDSVYTSLYSDTSRISGPVPNSANGISTGNGSLEYLSILQGSLEGEKLKKSGSSGDWRRQKQEAKLAAEDVRTILSNSNPNRTNTHDYVNEEAVEKKLPYDGPSLSLSIPDCSTGAPTWGMPINAPVLGTHGGGELTEADRLEQGEGEHTDDTSVKNKHNLTNKNDYVNSKADQSQWKYSRPSLSLHLPDGTNRPAVLPPVPGHSEADGAAGNNTSTKKCTSCEDNEQDANERSYEGERSDEGQGVVPADLGVGDLPLSPHDSGFPREGSTSSTTYPKSYV